MEIFVWLIAIIIICVTIAIIDNDDFNNKGNGHTNKIRKNPRGLC